MQKGPTPLGPTLRTVSMERACYGSQSCSGVSGSTTTGHHVTIAGHVGTVGHIHIGSGAILTAKSGVTKDVPEGATMVGIPARPLLVDAKEYQKPFMPYGTPCREQFDPATQQLEILKCEVEQLQKRLAELAQAQDAASRRTSA